MIGSRKAFTGCTHLKSTDDNNQLTDHEYHVMYSRELHQTLFEDLTHKTSISSIIPTRLPLHAHTHTGMEKKSSVMTPAERKVVAFHEAGHTLTGWLLEHTDPITKACDHHMMGIQLSCHQHVTLFPPGQYHPKDKRHPGVCPVSPLRPEVVLNRTGQVICFTAAALQMISTFPHSCTAV